MKNWHDNFIPEKIVAIKVYSEGSKSRIYVGRLEMRHKWFIFTYDKKYLFMQHALSLGPDLALTKQEHRSRQLFNTMQDRIPSRKNPAYEDYCDSVGISKHEDNPIVLLATIGKRGPSSFVFDASYERKFSAQDLKTYRKRLQLSVREFAIVFDISSSSIIKIENKQATGKDVLKRIELYNKFPQTALYEVMYNGGALLPHKREKIIDILSKSLNEGGKNV